MMLTLDLMYNTDPLFDHALRIRRVFRTPGKPVVWVVLTEREVESLTRQSTKAMLVEKYGSKEDDES